MKKRKSPNGDKIQLLEDDNKRFQEIVDNLRTVNTSLDDENRKLTNEKFHLQRDLQILSDHRETLMHGQILFRNQVANLQKSLGIITVPVDLNKVL